MKLIETGINGCYEIFPKIFEDHRGLFVKPYNIEEFKKIGIRFKVYESFFVTSNLNVLRGMHFQAPPKSVDKLITCLDGKVFDVLIDLRKNSISYLHTFTTILDSELRNMIFAPKGIAHGYYTLMDNSLVLYGCSNVHFPRKDIGIKWDSIGVQWPIVSEPIISDKDSNFIKLSDFRSPF